MHGLADDDLHYFDAEQSESVDPFPDAATVWYYFDPERSMDLPTVWYYFDSDIEQSVDPPIWHDAAESFVTPQCLSLIEMAFYWLVNTILRGVHALLLMDHWWVPVAVVSVCGIFASLPTQAQSSILGIGAFFVCNSIIESDFDWIHRFRDRIASLLSNLRRRSIIDFKGICGPVYRQRQRQREIVGYPRVYMILSCVMWSMAFVASYTGGSWHGCSVAPATIGQAKTKQGVHEKPPETNDDSTFTRANEILLGIEQAESTVPTFAMTSEKRCRNRLRKSMWNKTGVAYASHGSPTTNNDNTTTQLRSRLTKMLEAGPFSLLGDALPIIADTGCTMASSFDPLDFEGDIIPMASGTRMQGIGAAVTIQGRGTIKWTVIDDNGTSRVIRTPGYYVPAMHVRLFSPQAYMLDPTSSCTEFRINVPAATLSWNHGLHTLTIPYDDATTLPFMRAYRNPVKSAEAMAAQFSVTDAMNQNLGHGQKDLLKWHTRLGHLGFAWIKWLARSGFLGPLGSRMNACEAPLCASCQLGRAHKRPTGSKLEKKHPGAGDKMKAGVLFPGQAIATDQYETRIRGRIPGSRGSTPLSSMYRGGTIFVDICSGKVWAYHQVSLSANDTIRSKMNFERDCHTHGVGVQAYHGDNGIFNSAEFLRELDTKGQGIQLSGVGAHHQNGVAERAIKTVMERARTLMLHAAIHWPEARDEQLWPLAVDYSLQLWNNTPKEGVGLSPEELFSRSKGDGSSMLNSHVWGCPTYVLDPKLQDGKKLPKWEPRSRRGQFVGVSSRHSSTVGLIRNLTTGYVSPQFHVVFDDWFETVTAPADRTPPEWEELVAFSRFQNVLDDAVDPPALDDDWLDETARKARTAEEALRRQGRERAAQPVEPAHDVAVEPTTDNPVLPPVVPNMPHSPVPELSEPPPSHVTWEANPADGDVPQTPIKVEENTDPPSPVVRTSRGRTITRPKRLIEGNVLLGLTLATSIFGTLAGKLGPHIPTESRAFALLHSQLMEPETGFLDTLHPWAIANPIAFSAGKTSDPDNPTLKEAMLSKDAAEYTEAMGIEVAALEKNGTWTPALRSSLPHEANVLPGTWALKLKRYPDGRVRKYKARYCVRGDKQIKGVDYHETYAPVVAWTTVRMMMVMAATLNLKTTQIDFSNAFVQADLQESVYIELPTRFRSPTGSVGDYVLKLNKSLYGLCQAPKSWFDKLSAELHGLGFVPSSNDPCMFVHPDMIILVYCDDCLIFSSDQSKVDEMIVRMRKAFPGGLTVEDSVFAFLGVEVFADNETGKIKLGQSGLIKKILAATKLTDCNSKRTPASSTTLGSDQLGEECVAEWDYASVVGMLMYLSSNSRPDIQFAVHQCARFTHSPRKSHEEAVNYICRYLKGTVHEGIVFDPDPSLKLDCYGDADFAGLWGSEDSQDAVCVKSRTGYVLTLGGCPLLWVSRLQSEIALSTLESEYISMSQAMRDLIPMRRLLKEVSTSLGVIGDGAAIMKSTFFEDNNGALGLATSPKLTPRTRHIAVKYHFFKEHIKPGEIEIVKVASEFQKADIFTKGLTTFTFESIRKLLMGW
jgi:hypothetical protein